MGRLEILQRYMDEQRNLQCCIDILETNPSIYVKGFYEKQADSSNETMSKMEETHPFLVEILQILDKETQ
jgi:hypothetical protein